MSAEPVVAVGEAENILLAFEILGQGLKSAPTEHTYPKHSLELPTDCRQAVEQLEGAKSVGSNSSTSKS
jgi:hypothetical protein